MTMFQLVRAIEGRGDCQIRTVAGLPTVDPNRLPEDIKEFYSMAGGATLFDASPYGIEIVSPSEFVRSNPVIVGDVCEEDITHDWYIVAKNGEQYITIDLAAPRLGRCYDSFWDRHGVPGSCPVVARNFTELLERLFQAEGKQLFWLGSQFEELGDAYDPV